MKFFLFLTAFGLSVFSAKAQKVTGSVQDEQNKAITSTTVSLLKATDSTLAKLSTTDNSGNYSFDGVAAGKYFVSVTNVGYQPYMSSAFEVNGAPVALPVIKLLKAEATMEGVTVTARKPMVEVKADKTILNVEGTINATGNDALELLRKAPGVMVDKDDNLTMAGKNGVQVFIDGKPSPLSGTDLANFLKTLQSSQVEAIELITNPSAKYEAAGNAGIINIKLKKNKTFGTNGSVNAGYNIGTYAKYNGGISLNHRNKNINVFGNYNYSQGLNGNWTKMNREIADTMFNQHTNMKFYYKTHNFKTGIDYFLNSKSTIGAIVNGNIADIDMKLNGNTPITDQSTGVTDRLLKSRTTNDMSRTNLNFNLNYRYAVTGGSELNVDADYGIFNLRSNQFQPNYYFEPDGTTPKGSEIYRMITPTDITLYSTKVDYETNFKKGKLGIGGKVGFVNTDNDFQRYDVINGNNIYDQEASNKFIYKENVNALYVNYNRAFTGFMFQVGLRMENTDSKGKSTGLKYNSNSSTFEPYDSTLHRNYTDLFPSAALTFNKNPMSQFGITFSRRIDRPAYQDLNPFEFRLDAYTYQKGNTQLKPQYTNSIGFTHTYKYTLNTSLNYSRVQDIFAQVPDVTQVSKAYMIKRNLATQDIVSLNISYPFQYKFYSFFANLNSYYSLYKADLGAPGDESRKVNQDVFALSYYMQNTFKINKTLTAELSGFYSSPSIWQGIFKSREMWGIDAGAQQVILKGKGTLRLTVSDIFKTMRWAGSGNFAGMRTTASGRWESQQLKLNFTYRFGNTQVKAARQRKTGLEDESKRAADGGGSTTPAKQ